MAKYDDIRILRTKQSLHEALLQLLGKKGIQEVRIRELCELAGINRTTFYNHYGSQYDLLNEMGITFLMQISGRLEQADSNVKESVQEKVTTVLQYLLDNRRLSLLLLNNSSDPAFAERLFSLEKISELLSASLPDDIDDNTRKATVAFAVYGSYRLLLEWINAEKPCPSGEEAALILRLARRVCCA